LGNLYIGLQVKENIVKYRNGALEKNSKDLQSLKVGDDVIRGKIGATEFYTEWRIMC